MIGCHVCKTINNVSGFLCCATRQEIEQPAGGPALIVCWSVSKTTLLAQ